MTLRFGSCAVAVMQVTVKSNKMAQKAADLDRRTIAPTLSVIGRNLIYGIGHQTRNLRDFYREMCGICRWIISLRYLPRLWAMKAKLFPADLSRVDVLPDRGDFLGLRRAID
jgi:hypothetical protein